MQYPARVGGDAFAAARVFKQHRKLIAADARSEAVFADAGNEARGDDLQQLVADGVAMHVIDRLEAIEIDENQRKGALLIADQLRGRRSSSSRK